MRRCGVVSAIHGLRRVGLGRSDLAPRFAERSRRSGRPSLLVKISVAPGSISTGRWSRMCRFSSASNESLIGTVRTLADVFVGPRCGDPFGGVNSCRSTSMVFCRKFTRSTVSPAASPGRRPAVAINHTNAVRCGGAASAMRRTSSKSSATTCDAAVLMVLGSWILIAGERTILPSCTAASRIETSRTWMPCTVVGARPLAVSDATNACTSVRVIVASCRLPSAGPM